MSWLVAWLAILAGAGASQSLLDVDCSPGTKRPVPGRCRQFQICSPKGGLWTTSTCPEGELFDRVHSICKSSSLVKCVEASKECNFGSTYPISDDCSSYFKCGPSNDYTIEKCPHYSRYHSRTSSCQPAWKVDCRENLKCNASAKLPISNNNQGYMQCVEGYWKTVDCPEDRIFDFDKQECDLPLPNIQLNAISCQEGEKSGVVGQCDWYYLCKDGRQVLTKCPLLERFDQKKRECDWFFKVSCSTCVDGQTIPSQNCKQYYECNGGEFKKKTCPELQRFDGVRGECIASILASCAKCECEYQQKEGITGDCGHYKECRNCQFVIEKCPWLHHYVENDKSCEWSMNTDCTAMECGKEGYRMSKVGDCRHFLECKNGLLTTQKCRFGYFFDNPTKVCVPKENANCITGFTHSSFKVQLQTNKEISNDPTPSTTTDSSSAASTTPPSTTTATCAPGDKMSVAGSCVDYLECDQNGVWVDKSCTSWCKNFNGTQCVWAWKFPCSTPTPTVPPCKNGTRKPDPNNCKDYFECDSGSFVQKSCSWYQKFNTEQLKCEGTWWVFC